MNYTGMKALVMGLGLHGGGLESARYLARHGADVTVTDLRDEKTLAPSIEKLEAAGDGNGLRRSPIRYVLGRHDMADFEKADLVIKNPGVRPDSPYLKAARQIETDISIFLANSPARLIAVTGSKGKSSTSSALHWALQAARGELIAARKAEALRGKAWLGGNITVSPLSFLDELTPDDDVVLELSSWQLGDLKDRLRPGSAGLAPIALLKPRAAVLTAIMPDHLDRYGTMEAYVADKRIIYQGQDEQDATIAADDSWGRSFLAESRGRPLVYAESPLPEGVSGGWLTGPDGPGLARLYGPRSTGNAGSIPAGIKAGETFEAVPAQLLVPGYHQKKNLLAAALALLDLGLDAETVRQGLASFPGIEHRLEFFHQARGVRFYNDTAATIPEAAAAAIEAFGHTPLVLITGGADKNLDYDPLVKAAPRARAVILLAGTGSDKLKGLFAGAGISYQGPFDTVDAAVKAVLDTAKPGDTAVLSPGCASFGMFLNEFDRGKKWKDAVLRLA
ncbi:UDP-N-acetylmuramoylalanine--D-glutamate ligase [Spirochaetia bacterium]|nr:UDP-N-acetylmuramoylalanine--D-glutamate ligase [Spirochaetia bacterium]